MSKLEVYWAVEPADSDEDRVAVRREGDSVLIALADGAGGVSGGRDAAEHVTAALASTPIATHDFAAVLRRWDDELARDSTTGECAIALLSIADGRIHGASVGDCEAWLVSDSVTRLTAAQERKPLLGSGSTRPVSFEHDLNGTLLVASDGLFKYAPPDSIRNLLSEPGDVTQHLIDLVRLPNGDLWDDVSVAVVRPGRDSYTRLLGAQAGTGRGR